MSAEKCVQNEHIENQVFRVSDEFGQLTGPRLARHGSCSGEALRIKIAEKLKTIGSGKLTVILDDVHGYGSSFLEEAFAGLVRHWDGDLMPLMRLIFMKRHPRSINLRFGAAFALNSPDQIIRAIVNSAAPKPVDSPTLS